MKGCIKCGEEKPLEMFNKNSKSRDGRGSYCKTCTRAYNAEYRKKNPTVMKDWYYANHERAKASIREKNFRNLYGKDRNYFVQYLAEQQHGRCGSCRKPIAFEGRGVNSAVVDHDHSTGEFRAILCRGCNSALGHMQDDITVACRLVDYLESHMKRKAI